MASTAPALTHVPGYTYQPAFVVQVRVVLSMTAWSRLDTLRVLRSAAPIGRGAPGRALVGQRCLIKHLGHRMQCNEATCFARPSGWLAVARSMQALLARHAHCQICCR
jgi:hypothetical protein